MMHPLVDPILAELFGAGHTGDLVVEQKDEGFAAVTVSSLQKSKGGTLTPSARIASPGKPPSKTLAIARKICFLSVANRFDMI